MKLTTILILQSYSGHSEPFYIQKILKNNTDSNLIRFNKTFVN